MPTLLNPDVTQMLATIGYVPVWANELEEGWECALIGHDWQHPEEVVFFTAASVHHHTKYQEDENGRAIRGSGYTITRFFAEYDDGHTQPFIYTETYAVWVRAI